VNGFLCGSVYCGKGGWDGIGWMESQVEGGS
jgi:hypothetical protein